MIARSTGAAPRQRGSSDGCTFSQRCRSRSRAEIRRRRRPRRPSRRRGARTRWTTGIPSRSAASFAGGGDAAARARRRVGRVSRNRPRARREPLEDVGAEGRGGREADRAHRLPEHGLRAEHGHRLPPRLRRRPVDDQHAVEVVELVLDDARLQPLSSSRTGAPVASGPRASPRRGARPRRARAGARGSPPRRLPLVARVDDARVDGRDRPALLAGPEDEHAPEHADLGRREADAVRIPISALIRSTSRRGRRRSPRPPAPACAARDPATGGSARARAGGAPRAPRPAARPDLSVLLDLRHGQQCSES